MLPFLPTVNASAADRKRRVSICTPNNKSELDNKIQQQIEEFSRSGKSGGDRDNSGNIS
jgi:hypothetical protein